jgi:hypothetical protein
VKARAPAKGNAWSAFYGAISPQITALVKGEYADDARWESKTGAEDGCKRNGFQMRVAGYLKANADDGEGGYAEPDEDDIVLAVEYILDNPDHQSATAEARGGMSVKQMKAAGLKVAKPVAKPAPAPAKKPVAAPAPVKKAKVKVPEPESDEEEEPAPAPAPAKKTAPPKGKVAVAAAAAAVAAVATADEPDADELAAAGLKAMPKSTNLRHVDTKMIYASMAEFKKGISIGTWGKGADGKMGIQPNQAPSNAAAAPAPAPVAEEAEEAEEDI